MSDAKLRLCPNPWCVKGACLSLWRHSKRNQLCVMCDCGLRGPYEDDRKTAIAAWNRRPAEDALRSALEELLPYVTHGVHQGNNKSCAQCAAIAEARAALGK